MQSDPAELWEAALKDLAQQVSRANFDTFLHGTEGIRLNDDALTVGTRSEFVTEWLQQRLLPSILRTVTDLGGRELRVDFEPLRDRVEGTAPPALQPADDHAPAPKQQAATPRPRLRERYSFENYAWRSPPRRASRRAPGSSTTRCSSMARRASARRTCCTPSVTAW
jgi:chromosomal replication initiation ATPase DnaA